MQISLSFLSLHLLIVFIPKIVQLVSVWEKFGDEKSVYTECSLNFLTSAIFHLNVN